MRCVLVAEIRFPVDPVHVMLFARAVCDDNPAYRGEAAVTTLLQKETVGK